MGADRIFICEHCKETFLRKAFEQHKFCDLTKRCYDTEPLINRDVVFIPDNGE